MLNGVDSERVEVNDETREDCLINVVLEITRLKFCFINKWSILYIRHQLFDYLKEVIIRDLYQFFPDFHTRSYYLSKIYECGVAPLFIRNDYFEELPDFYKLFLQLIFEIDEILQNDRLESTYQDILNCCIKDDQNSQYLNDTRRQKQFQLGDHNTRMTRYCERVCNERFKNKETQE